MVFYFFVLFVCVFLVKRFSKKSNVNGEVVFGFNFFYLNFEFVSFRVIIFVIFDGVFEDCKFKFL